MPDYDKDVRQAYRGGFTYLKPEYREQDLGEGLVLDVNSLYPWVMHDCPLPYGEPIYFEGKYEPDDMYNLYVQCFRCDFKLKEGYIPSVQLKHNLAFIPTEYIVDSGTETPVMYMTNVDLEVFLEHYEVFNVEWFSGWKFRSTTGMFTSYIDKWMEVKIESSRNGNKGMRTLSKLMLNALYGKFALSPEVQSKIPYLNEGRIAYTYGEKEQREPLYIPVGVFVTSWARHKTITSAQKMYKYFVYADTDSLHLHLPLPETLSKMSNKELENLTTKDLIEHGLEMPEGFEVDPVALGAWKIESKFNRARFLRQKSYMEDWNPPETWDNPETYKKDLLNITCAGMPPSCYQFVTWENFHIGASYEGKLLPKHVKGGIVLQETEFTIHP